VRDLIFAMVRNMVVIGGSSHPQLVETICNQLGVPPAKIFLGKFAVGETRVEIQESIRGKDIFIIQSGGGKVNDHLMELLITISACKTASANRVTAVLPLFPYSRQSDIPYNKVGAPLSKGLATAQANGGYTFDSRPQTPKVEAADHKHLTNGTDGLHKQLGRLQMTEGQNGVNGKQALTNGDSTKSSKPDYFTHLPNGGSADRKLHERTKPPPFEPQRGYRQWVAQAGTLVADLLTCAGADHVITMDLHDPQYQGFFDIPVDNLYGRHLLRRYIQYQIPNYQQAVIVSPDAGGAKRATAIADALGMPFALIHKVCSPAHPFHAAPPSPFIAVG
jgi:ribose-phosphate pyrophosphokinase